jgi:ribosomal protein L24E
MVNKFEAKDVKHKKTYTLYLSNIKQKRLLEAAGKLPKSLKWTLVA